MKISELISKLQYVQHVSGDLEVVIVSPLDENFTRDVDKIKISTDSKQIEVVSKKLPYIIE